MRTVQHAFQDMIDGLGAAQDEPGLRSVADRACKRLGFRWFAYLAYDKSEATIISSYPKAWVDHYRANRFERIDPVVSPARWPGRSFFWSGDKERYLTADERRLFGEARCYGIRCGVTVPIHVSGGSFAAFTLAAEEQGAKFKRYAKDAIDTLQLMGLYYHVSVEAKLRLVPARTGGALLTLRETECLAWAARGKTMADTAQILGITRRTIEFHLDNAKVKLDALTVSQAVAEAIRRDLLPRN